jgi:hypothetical protein
MKKFAIITMIASVHFGLAVLIVNASQWLAAVAQPMQAEPPLVFRILVVATRILHFPIISLSLYSRQWFPGNWIYVPIFVNSLLWAAGIYALLMLAKKYKRKQ